MISAPLIEHSKASSTSDVFATVKQIHPKHVRLQHAPEILKLASKPLCLHASTAFLQFFRDLYKKISKASCATVSIVALTPCERIDVGGSWFLDSVTVSIEGTPRQWSFPCHQWLSKSHGDKQISRELHTFVEPAVAARLAQEAQTTVDALKRELKQLQSSPRHSDTDVNELKLKLKGAEAAAASAQQVALQYELLFSPGLYYLQTICISFCIYCFHTLLG